MVFAYIKNFLFPERLPTPPGKDDLDRRRAHFVRSFVSAHAAGNVALSRGHFWVGK
jgi:hypothetical protein